MREFPSCQAGLNHSNQKNLNNQTITSIDHSPSRLIACRANRLSSHCSWKKQRYGSIGNQLLTAIFAAFTLFFLIFLPSQALAAQVTLAWDPITPAPEGYQVFERVEGGTYNYSTPVWPQLGDDPSQTTCTIGDLPEDIKFYFVVRAYVGSNHSGDSNEVSFKLSNGTPDAIDTDDDDDGMPDTWEAQYGLNPLIDDAGEDPDKDGYSNLEEYQAGTNPIEAGVNRQPNQPTITQPQDGDERVELSPRLSAFGFEDPDPGDTHKQTQWRIIDTNRQLVVWDVTAQKRGWTTIRVQRLVLSPSTNYDAMVRYYDQDGTPSEWSEPVSFTTGANTKDNNRNKIPDAQEVPAHTDLNTDTIPDNDQLGIIMSVTTYDGHYLMAAGVDFDTNDATMERVESVDPTAIEERPANETETPYGLLAYNIKVPQPGDSALVSIYLSRAVPSTTTQWVSFDSVNGWQDCTGNTQLMAEGMMAQRSIQDGGAGDADGTANGIIVELFGPQSVSPSQDSGSGLTSSDGNAASSEESGGSVGCFINALF